MSRGTRFGKVIYEQGSYRELLLAQDGETRLILCIEGLAIKLYRIEWFDKEVKSSLNSAQHTLLEAIEAYQEAIAMQQEAYRKAVSMQQKVYGGKRFE